MKPLTDKEIIQAIRAGGRAQEEALRQLYSNKEYRRLAEFAARSFSGNAQDVEDLLQEGLWILFQKVKKGEFEERSTLKTFFGSIVNHIGLNKYSKQLRCSVAIAGLTIATEEGPTEEDMLLWKEKTALLEKPFSTMKEKCQSVLEYWACGYSMKEIAELTGLKDEMAAKNKKKNCLKALRDWMKDHPKTAKWFKDGL
ncbi:MAG: sigma-70 family RNA polymerase sigma factor [Bacteroidetes bacterium]|nr:sigma-70 family RNA polymerase sigma factor [Bacteroidota bacterium]